MEGYLLLFALFLVGGGALAFAVAFAALTAADTYHRSLAVIGSELSKRLADVAAAQLVWSQRESAAIRGIL